MVGSGREGEKNEWWEEEGRGREGSVGKWKGNKRGMRSVGDGREREGSIGEGRE